MPKIVSIFVADVFLNIFLGEFNLIVKLEL